MITTRKLVLMCAVVTAIALVVTMGQAGHPKNQKGTSGVQKVTTNDVYHPMLINNIFNYYSNNGDGSFNKFSADNEGFEFPKGSGGEVIFEDGVVWGGFQNDTLKVGGSTYNHGLQS